MKQSNVRFNYHDYLQLPEDKRYEILDGELYVVPAPNTRHQRISKRIQIALIRQIEENGLGEVFNAPCDVVFSEENVVQPDILFVRKERLGIIGEANLPGRPTSSWRSCRQARGKRISRSSGRSTPDSAFRNTGSSIPTPIQWKS